ncbi:MAG TPA: pseudouridine synthase [Anaerolineaceae bacterium]|nr:pseudouridine synthase [Anaerolineaceae bacterium]
MEERIQKILARAGLGSRRSCEDLITAGRVVVNGVRVELGAKADPERDKIFLDGKPLPKMESPTYIALHKPRGVLSDDNPEDSRPTVRTLVPVEGHLFAVGRLDLDSEGLILLTNDGELANHLTHPRYEHEKEYRVLLVTHPDEEQLAIWRRGVVLEDGYRTAPAKVDVEGNVGKGTWLRIVMHEGKKRQIREVGKTIGLPVERIIRVRIATLKLGNLKPGEWRYLTREEVAALQDFVASKAPQRRPHPRPQRPRRM